MKRQRGRSRRWGSSASSSLATSRSFGIRQVVRLTGSLSAKGRSSPCSASGKGGWRRSTQTSLPTGEGRHVAARIPHRRGWSGGHHLGGAVSREDGCPQEIHLHTPDARTVGASCARRSSRTLTRLRRTGGGTRGQHASLAAFRFWLQKKNKYPEFIFATACRSKPPRDTRRYYTRLAHASLKLRRAILLAKNGAGKGKRTSLVSLAPTNPSVRELRHGETPVSPTPFPFNSYLPNNKSVRPQRPDRFVFRAGKGNRTPVISLES